MSKLRLREALWFYLFASPWIIGFVVFLLGPMIASIYISLTDWDSFTPPKFVGLENYTRLLTEDPVFWKALWNTFYYAAISVPLGLGIGLWLANLLNKQVRLRKVFRTLIYLPTLVPLVATAMIFKMVLAPSGPLNDVLGVFSIPGPSWLLESIWVKPALILLSVWGAGGATVLLLAAMKGIPRELYRSGRGRRCGTVPAGRGRHGALRDPRRALRRGGRPGDHRDPPRPARADPPPPPPGHPRLPLVGRGRRR